MGGGSRYMGINKKGVRQVDEEPDTPQRELFTIGTYIVMVRDVVWLLIIVVCVVIALLGMLVKNSAGALNAISAASTLLSIALSFIAIIKSMIDSADAARVKSKTESSLNRLDEQIELLFSESEIHKKNQNELKEKVESIKNVLSVMTQLIEGKNEDKQQLIEKLSDSDMITEIEDLRTYFIDFFN